MIMPERVYASKFLHCASYIPGAFSDGFNIKVLPHVTAIGNIRRKPHSNQKIRQWKIQT